MWRVYYGDGSSYSGSVEDAPTRNVQLIVQSSKRHGWSAVAGKDYFVWWDDRWLSVDIFGLYDYLLEPGWKKVLFGRMLASEEYDQVWHIAMNDPEMPPKTGFDKRERRPVWAQQ